LMITRPVELLTLKMSSQKPDKSLKVGTVQMSQKLACFLSTGW
jgi:hypothetical protein